MKNWLQNWNFFRMIRLAVGVFILIEGIRSQSWMLILWGALFSLMPLFNFGCCASGNCAIPNPKNKQNIGEEISFEEVKKQ